MLRRCLLTSMCTSPRHHPHPPPHTSPPPSPPTHIHTHTHTLTPPPPHYTFQREDINVFADEHMVEMNRRPTTPLGKRRRLRAPSPRPPKPPTPTPPSSTNTAPPHTNNTDKTDSKSQAETNGELNSEEARLPVSKDVKLNQPEGPLEASRLPTQEPISEPSSVHSPPILSRKRDRTPSPTPMTSAPLPKRQALEDLLTPPPLSSPALIPRGGGGGGGGGGGTVQNHNAKTPSPVQGLSVSRLGKPEFSSASKVLTEEIQKQRESDNAKLKTLIVKEIRKPGKSKKADIFDVVN